MQKYGSRAKTLEVILPSSLIQNFAASAVAAVLNFSAANKQLLFSPLSNVSLLTILKGNTQYNYIVIK